MTDYRATPEQWEQVLSWSKERDVSVSCDAACILELRARVEALEAKNKPGFMELSVTTTTAPVCRPKPPSLKEQALELARPAGTYGAHVTFGPEELALIRRALEALPE
jgi:hypothetical protein